MKAAAFRNSPRYSSSSPWGYASVLLTLTVYSSTTVAKRQVNIEH